MKESKKSILKALSADKKKASKFDKKVLLLALQKIDSEEFDLESEAVFTADKKMLVYCLSKKDNYSIPEGVEVIGEQAFCRKANLKNIIIPSTVKRISNDAFYNCDSLDNVYIPASVTDVNSYSFAECDNLKKVTFAGTPKHLSRHAFENCDELHNITIPKGSLKAFQKALHYDAVDDEYLLTEKEK